MTILQVLTDTGRYPMTVYPWWLRVIVTIIVPIGLATTVPIQALRGEQTGWNVLIFLDVSIIALFFASQVWKVGAKQYSGASSYTQDCIAPSSSREIYWRFPCFVG